MKSPSSEAAPSNLIISGRYILQPEIFAELDKQGTGCRWRDPDHRRDEAPHAITALPWRSYKGTTYDCGDKVGFLAANVALAMEREDIGPAFRDVLNHIISTHGGKLTWD